MYADCPDGYDDIVAVQAITVVTGWVTISHQLHIAPPDLIARHKNTGQVNWEIVQVALKMNQAPVDLVVSHNLEVAFEHCGGEDACRIQPDGGCGDLDLKAGHGVRRFEVERTELIPAGTCVDSVDEARRVGELQVLLSHQAREGERHHCEQKE